MSAGSVYGIGNISSAHNDYKPQIPLQIPCIIDDGNSVLGVGMAQLYTNGVIYVMPLTAGTAWRRVCIYAEWDV